MRPFDNSLLRGLAAAFILAGGSCMATGQESAPVSWTLQECIDYAMAHNLDIVQKQISIRQNDVDIEAKKGALFPSLSFSTNQNASWRPWSDSYVNITDGSMSSTTSTVNYNGTYGLQAQWTVWNGGINKKQILRSEAAREQSVLDEETTRLTIQEQIAQLYVQILYQTDAVEVCEEILASTKVQYDRALNMYDVGKMSKADLAQVEAQVSQEEYNLSNAVSQLSTFKMQLRQLLELPDNSIINCAVPAIDDSRVLSPLPPVNSVYEQALVTRPELKYDSLGMKIADMDIDIAKRGHYPTVSLQGGINTSASSGLKKNWADQLKSNLSNMLGLTLSVPIFDNRQTSTSVARARLDYESAQISLAQQKKQLYNSIETLWLNAANAKAQYKYALTNVGSMQQSYDLVCQQFEVGLKDIVDLTTAKNNLVQAQQQLIQSKYTVVLNTVLLDFYSGNPLSLN